MFILGAIFIATAFVYFLTQQSLARSWDDLPQVEMMNPDKLPEMVSILVPARNEASSIRKCLASLLAQDYLGAVEIFLLDNHSQDDTAAIASQLDDDRLKIIRLAEILPESTTFKKEAISYGVNHAKGEYILLVDGDCQAMDRRWLHTMVSSLCAGYDYVSGPVKLLAAYGDQRARLESLDFSGLQVVTGGGLQTGQLLSSNGANHAFRKASFEAVEGYQDNEHIRSGDDLFLLHKLWKNGAKLGYVKSRRAIICSSTQNSLATFLAQRRRWASKSGDLAHRSTKAITLLVFITSVCIVLALCMAIVFPALWWMCFTVWVLKMSGDVLVLRRGTRFFQEGYSWIDWIAAHLLHPIYVIWIGILSIIPTSQKWKDRLIS